MLRDTGDFSTDSAAAEGLIRELLKEAGHQSVVVSRGLEKVRQAGTQADSPSGHEGGVHCAAGKS